MIQGRNTHDITVISRERFDSSTPERKRYGQMVKEWQRSEISVWQNDKTRSQSPTDLYQKKNIFVKV